MKLEGEFAPVTSSEIEDLRKKLHSIPEEKLASVTSELTEIGKVFEVAAQDRTDRAAVVETVVQIASRIARIKALLV